MTTIEGSWREVPGAAVAHKAESAQYWTNRRKLAALKLSSLAWVAFTLVLAVQGAIAAF